MKYFKNTELAKLYNVSEKSVRNWIQAALDGKLDLQLYEKNGKPFIENTSKNMLTVEKLVQRGKKFKNSRGLKTISPSIKFYKTFSIEQIFDIISNLTIHHELPLKYSYADGGAEYWNKYANRLASEETPNILTKSIELLDTSAESLNRLLGDRKYVNVIDLGPGNGLPVRSTLQRLLDQGRLRRYIAIDSSKEMLNILEKNIKLWFGDSVHFEGYVRDFNNQHFDDLFIEDYAGDDAEIPLNLVLLLGGTLCNFRQPDQVLQVVNSSLRADDLFIYTTKLDTPATRRFFDFNPSGKTQDLSPRHKLLPDLLRISESLYTTSQYFDEEKQARTISITPKIDIQLKFEFDKGTRSIDLRKNQPILLWRSRNETNINIINRLEKNNFDLMLSSRIQDQEYILLVSKLKINS